jgi:hypothetical protein
VRNGPKPVSVATGVGTLVHVTLEEPLKGAGSSRVTIDLSEAMRARCAAVVTEGQLFAGGAARNAGAPVQTADASAAALETPATQALTPVNGGGTLTPVTLEATDVAGM